MLVNTRGELVKDGHVRRGQLGVTVQGVTSDLAKSLGLSEVRGALLSGVNLGSPGDEPALLMLSRQGSDFFVALAPRRVPSAPRFRSRASRWPGAARPCVPPRAPGGAAGAWTDRGPSC